MVVTALNAGSVQAGPCFDDLGKCLKVLGAE